MERRDAQRMLAMAIALFAIGAFFAWRQPVFLSARNLSLMLIEVSASATLALGMLIVLLPGQIDLSAGSGVGLCGAVAAVLVLQHGLAAPLALLAAAVLAVALWTGIGSVIALQRIPAFIITLGGLLVFKGLHLLTIQNRTVPVVEGGETNAYSLLTTYYVPARESYALLALIVAALGFAAVRARRRGLRYGLRADDASADFLRVFVTCQLVALLVIMTAQYRGLPLSLLVLALVAVAVHVLTRHTPLGRYLYAIGSNEEAAFMAGVPVRASVIAAFALMGAIVALTGFMQTSYAGASTTTVGNLMELDAVAACVIGGTSLRGGRGGVLGVLFGALIMACLLNGMTLMALEPEVKLIARGVVLALAVWLDVRLGGA